MLHVGPSDTPMQELRLATLGRHWAHDGQYWDDIGLWRKKEEKKKRDIETKRETEKKIERGREREEKNTKRRKRESGALRGKANPRII